jgi:large conductance mechanosensitive channel
MPPLSLILGKSASQSLIASENATLAEARRPAPLNLGLFLNAIVDFVIIAFCISIAGSLGNRRPPSGPPKDCPQCAEKVLASAKKCRYCTSAL